MNKINKLLLTLVILLSISIVFLSGYIIYENKTLDKPNITNNDSQDDILNVGLDLYKFATGSGTGPFKWENNEVVNYVEVISKFTQEYFDKSADEKHFSIPYKDGESGKWLSYGGWGTTTVNTFKDITIKSQSDTVVEFLITYDAVNIENKLYENSDVFVIKKVDNEWKIHDFKLVIGLKF